MVEYNIQMKKNTDGIWDNLYPFSLSKNIYDKERQKTIEELFYIYENKLATIVPFSNYKPDPTGVTDSYDKLKLALEELKENETLLFQPSATYKISKEIKIFKHGKLSIDGNGSIIKSDVSVTNQDVDGKALDFRGVFKKMIGMIEPLKIGSNTIKVNDTTNLKIGDLVYFQSTEQFNSSRDYYKKGGTFTIAEIVNTNTIRITGSFPYKMSNASIQVYSPITVKIKNLTVIATNALPAGRFGLHIQYAVNSVLEDLNIDNFNHCYHLESHYNTIVKHVKSGRSLFYNSSESYGFASYMGTFLSIDSSTFHSGRHGLEISGRENSFKTLITNTYASSEGDTIGFNLHQSSYDVLALNCVFDKFGLANHATLINCTLGDSTGTGSNFKTSEGYADSWYVFKECTFSENMAIQVTNDSINQDTTAKYIGLIKFEDCQTNLRLYLNLLVRETLFDNIIINNTDNVATSLNTYAGSVNQFLYMDSVYEHDSNMIVQNPLSVIENISFVRMKIRNRFNVISLTQFINLVFDSCTSYNLTDGNPDFSLTSKNALGAKIGKATFINTIFARMNLGGGGFNHLLLIGSELPNISSLTSIVKREKTTIETF